jgi:hypothetical protein
MYEGFQKDIKGNSRLPKDNKSDHREEMQMQNRKNLSMVKEVFILLLLKKLFFRESKRIYMERRCMGSP